MTDSDPSSPSTPPEPSPPAAAGQPTPSEPTEPAEPAKPADGAKPADTAKRPAAERPAAERPAAERPPGAPAAPGGGTARARTASKSADASPAGPGGGAAGSRTATMAPPAPATPPVPSGPTPLPPLWSARVWPLTKAGAPLGVLVGAAIAGLVGAVVLVTDTLGVGIGLLALVVLLAALATRPGAVRPRQAGFAAIAVALWGVASVRTAGWLIGLCLLAGLLAAVLAVTAGRTWTGLLVGALSPFGAVSRTARWAGRGVVPRLRGRRLPVGRIVAIGASSAVLLLVFGGLFAGADPVFADLVGGLVPEVDPARWIGRSVLFSVVAGLSLIAACLTHQAPDFDVLAPERGAGRPRAEWAIPLGALVALFACFVGVQLVVLAEGDRYVRTTAGLTYAEYARQGFWQLLAVTALTLLVVAVVVRLAGRESRADRMTLRVLLGALCLLATLVVASAIRRMWLYEDAYGFTRLRVLVQAAELWLGLVFVLVAVAGIRLRGSWLPRTVLATGALILLGLAALNPDAFIAERNTVRYAETGRIDVDYLSGLSADAAPALDRLPEPYRSCALYQWEYRLPADDEWYSASLGRSRAREILRERPPGVCRLNTP
ncbi:DUF4173 domain-containing protein [Cryptosporangium minutisporangium]|uniref:DUF4173 domain-containing protein n=1 Tax=Cryptosporangium minutisporangium TaxID=113569 RepID=A0ABP6SSI3_9ACTN